MVVPGFFFHKRKKKEESLARTHPRVPIAHSHESSVTHLRSPQICWTKKKESSVLSLLDVFFPQNVILRKKTEKTHPKHTHTHYTQKSLWVSPNKKATTLTHGEPSTLVQSTARGNPLFFFVLTRARERERERETFSSSGVALERSAFIGIPFRSPPNTSRGVQIFNRNADDASGRALAR